MDKSSGTEIKEALEYLVQSPYIHHHYFDAYETPVRLDMELTNGDAVFPVGDDFSRISECAARGVRLLQFFGGEQYEHLDCLLAVCRESCIQTEVVLKSKVSRERLAQIIKAGVDGFLVEIESAADTEKDAGVTTLSLLGELNYSEVRAKWFLRADNAAELAEVARRVETLGAKELIVAPMCAAAAPARWSGKSSQPVHFKKSCWRKNDSRDKRLLKASAFYSLLCRQSLRAIEHNMKNK